MPKAKTETVIVSVNSAPKKSTSSYMLFCKEERNKVKAELPNLKNTEIVTELAKRWSNLSSTDPARKDRLDKNAKSDQERYKSEKELFSKQPKAEVDKPVEETVKKTKKAKTEAKAPAAAAVVAEPAKKTKKAKSESAAVAATAAASGGEGKKTRVTGYINFSNEKRESVKKANPGLSPKDVMRQLALLWNGLSDSEKEKYKQI